MSGRKGGPADRAKPGIPGQGGLEDPRHFRRRRAAPDKGYDFDADRRWLRQRGIIPRIARRGIDTSERLGRYRWKIERTIAWFTGYRRLTIRYERKASLYGAFLSLAATLICWKKLPT